MKSFIETTRSLTPEAKAEKLESDEVRNFQLDMTTRPVVTFTKSPVLSEES